MRIVIAGGGTAGHVFPALALAEVLAADGHDVRFAGTPTGQEARLVPAAGFDLVPIPASPFVREVSLRALVAPAVALRSVGRARRVVEGADVVVGMGGYVSVPVALAALRSRVPLVVHEQNAVPGLANRILARPARTVALSFVEAARLLPRRARTVVTGNPIRRSILAVASDRERIAKEAYAELELDPERRTLVVFGGSQGALHLNRALIDALPHLPGDGLQVLLLAGTAHERSTRPAGGDAGVPTRVVPFLERMELAYAVADLVVARAGATTLAEVSACGVPSILVPYPYATGRHQEANARSLERAGGAEVIVDDDLTGPVLAELVSRLLADGGALDRMGERARAWSRPGAADALARAVAEAGGAA
jgi:UDP-N-acetylglucosamine--N-acetylmuramyl-(pentapeptide) pyrophosphoryl-undecaprenol N-acetylglucosamine transferase